MKAIKKVEVTPLDYNFGKIIDSATSSDDKRKNTYSMRIIDNKFNNLIENVSDNYISNTEMEDISSSISSQITNSATALQSNIDSVSTRINYYVPEPVYVQFSNIGQLVVDYPTGFNKSNCVVTSIMYQPSGGVYRTVPGGDSTIYSALTDNGILVFNNIIADATVVVVLQHIPLG